MSATKTAASKRKVKRAGIKALRGGQHPNTYPRKDAKTAPLSNTAIGCLRDLEVCPAPCNTINPGIVHKLVDEGYATIELRPSPYPSHKPGKRIDFLVVTAKGRGL